MPSIRWLAAIGLILAAAGAGAQTTVYVTSAEELVRAIGSDRTVTLASGEYVVSEAGQVSNPAVEWEVTDFGTGLVIKGVHDLTLSAPYGASVLCSSSQAAALTFVDCRGILLEALTIGHNVREACEGNVLVFARSTKIRVDNCDLFGSGLDGFSAVDCSGVEVRSSSIRDCSGGAVNVTNVEGLRLEKVVITRNRSAPLLAIDSSPGALFDSCRIEFNTGDVFLSLENSPGFSMPGTEISRNGIERLLNERSDSPDLASATLTHNLFPDPDAGLRELRGDEGAGEPGPGYLP